MHYFAHTVPCCAGNMPGDNSNHGLLIAGAVLVAGWMISEKIGKVIKPVTTVARVAHRVEKAGFAGTVGPTPMKFKIGVFPVEGTLGPTPFR